MELNNEVKITLTFKGAGIVNSHNRALNFENFRRGLKTDYTYGDEYIATLWELFKLFGGYSTYGEEIMFINLDITQ